MIQIINSRLNVLIQRTSDEMTLVQVCFRGIVAHHLLSVHHIQIHPLVYIDLHRLSGLTTQEDLDQQCLQIILHPQQVNGYFNLIQ